MKSRLLSPWLVLAAALATTTVVLFTRTVTASGQGQASAVVDVIPQPTTWQPFVAEVIQTTPGVGRSTGGVRSSLNGLATA
jgi:hypothetical protein